MSRPKGLPKTGGRKKGSVNKPSSFIADMLTDQGFNFAEELALVYGELTTTIDKRNFLMQLLPYFAAKYGERPLAVHNGDAPQVAEEESLESADVLKIVGEG